VRRALYPLLRTSGLHPAATVANKGYCPSMVRPVLLDGP